MATIGDLRVKLSADTDRLRRGLDRAKGMLSGFAAGVGVIGASIAAVFVKAAQAADTLDKTARRLGSTTESVQALGLASKEAGTDLGTAERAIARMRQTLGEAQAGMKNQAEAYQRLGGASMFVADAQTDTVTAFRRVAGRLAGVKDETERARLGTIIFGRAYTQLIPLLESGDQAFQDAADHFKQLGLAVSQEDVDKHTKVLDQWTRMTDTLEAVSIKITSDFAPQISEFLTWVEKMAVQVRSNLIFISEEMDKISEFNTFAGSDASGGPMGGHSKDPFPIFDAIRQLFQSDEEATERQTKAIEDSRRATEESVKVQRDIRDSLRTGKLAVQ